MLGTSPAVAQGATGTIRGHVTDVITKAPVVGATISIGARSATTRADGGYIITDVAPGSDSVRTRSIGYARASRLVTIRAGQTLVVDFELAPQAVNLAELVSVGYGTQRAGNITGAVTQVGSESFNTGRVISPGALIQSKVAGVQVVDNNDPGGGLSIRIRGTTSINASSEPLYVIDGLPVGTGGGLSAGRDPLNFLNPNDIESITVLRDASAASIYGSNGANGVVLIKTKSGQKGAPQISYTTSGSSSSVTRLPSMLNAAQFRAAVTQYAANNVSQLGSATTDWFSLIDRTAYGQSHDLSLAGEGQNSNYRLSLGYLTQDGVILGSTTDRLSLGINYTQHLYDDRLIIRTNLRGSRTHDLFTPGGVLSNAAQFGPTQQVYDATSASGFYEWPGNTLQSADNPVALLSQATDHGTTFRSIGDVHTEYRMPFLEALTANVQLGFDVTEANRQTFTGSRSHSQTKTGLGGSIFRTNPNQVNTSLQTYLNYAAPLGGNGGSIDLTGGYAYARSTADYSYLQATGLSTDLLGDNGVAGAKTLNPVTNPQNSKLISFFGRAEYNYNDRYLVTASIRHDGSSRFGPDNAWGDFPSVAAAWRLSEESFLKGSSSISDLKLRASWAKTGNQTFGNYQQYANYAVGDGQTQAQFGSIYIPTIRPSAVDPNIKWESTTSYDIGLDFGFHNQRLTGTLDWYTKTTKDMIFTVPVAAGTNFSNFLTTNIGSMENKGIEIALSAKMAQGAKDGFSWTADFTAAHNTNQLLTINPFGGAVQQILVGGVAGGVGTTIQVLQPGSPINSFYTCQQYYDGAGKPVQNKYVKATGDSVTNCLNSDRRASHNPAPDWILGHSSYMTWGKWDAGFTLRAYLGNYVYNNVASNLGTYSEVTRASPFNLNSSVLTTGFTSPQYLSDYYVEKGAFLRLDNITLGYTMKYRGQPMRLYATVQNAFTITGYSGVDPTAGLNGIDNNIYPRARTITGGLSIRM